MAFSCFFHVLSHPLIDIKPLPDTPETAKTSIEAAFSPLEAAFFGIEAFSPLCHNHPQEVSQYPFQLSQSPHTRITTATDC